MSQIKKSYIDRLKKKYKYNTKDFADDWGYVEEMHFTCSMVELSSPSNEESLLRDILIASAAHGAKAVVCNVVRLGAKRLLESFGFSEGGSYIGSHKRRVYTMLADISKIT